MRTSVFFILSLVLIISSLYIFIYATTAQTSASVIWAVTPVNVKPPDKITVYVQTVSSDITNVKVWIVGSKGASVPQEGWSLLTEKASTPITVEISPDKYTDFPRVYVALELYEGNQLVATGNPNSVGYNPSLIKEVLVNADVSTVGVVWSMSHQITSSPQFIQVNVDSISGDFDEVRVWAAGSTGTDAPQSGWTRWASWHYHTLSPSIKIPTREYIGSSYVYIVLDLVKDGKVIVSGYPYVGHYNPELRKEVSVSLSRPSIQISYRDRATSEENITGTIYATAGNFDEIRIYAAGSNGDMPIVGWTRWYTKTPTSVPFNYSIPAKDYRTFSRVYLVFDLVKDGKVIASGYKYSSAYKADLQVPVAIGTQPLPASPFNATWSVAPTSVSIPNELEVKVDSSTGNPDRIHVWSAGSKDQNSWPIVGWTRWTKDIATPTPFTVKIKSDDYSDSSIVFVVLELTKGGNLVATGNANAPSYDSKLRRDIQITK